MALTPPIDESIEAMLPSMVLFAGIRYHLVKLADKREREPDG
jgi:hypothetical protein